jgi:tetratricopeptide (TPR) repeat protein
MRLNFRIPGASGWLSGACWLLALGLAIRLQSSADGAGTEWSTNAPVPASRVDSTSALDPSSSGTNSVVQTGGMTVEDFNARLATVRYLEKTSQLEKAEPILISLLGEAAPDSIKQSALFELSAVVRMENDLPRAISIGAQFLERWPDDPRVPEMLLRQGQIYRQMGLNNLGLTKFYAVMTSALSLKVNNRSEEYPALVLEAQTEIAETYYTTGRYSEAAEYYSRLIKQNNPALNRLRAQFRLVRSFVAIGRNDEAASQARDFLSCYPDAPEQPEVHFYLAQALKQMDRNDEALQQVLLLLKEEKAKKQDHPETWAYWQQRAGNEVANQLYREGDYARALDIYVNLAQLDSAPAWQMPVKYQIGLTYERLQQTQKAIETYHDILKNEPNLSTNATPDQKTVFEMARWRADFLVWQSQAETANHFVAYSALLPGHSATNAAPPAASMP